MPFAEIQGQTQAIGYLQRLVGRGRVPHAFLFSGPEGIGKRTTALALAQALNCQTLQGDDACGECLACRKIAGLIHPDIHYLVPEGQNIKIDQIRERVQHPAGLTPLEGRHKVFILDPAEALTPEAANSLLKILEEPPAAVTLILVTQQPFALLPTVLSRCQSVRFHPLSTAVLSAWLQTKLGCSPQQAHAWAMLSGGRPAEALRLADPEARSLRDRVLEILQCRFSEPWPVLGERWGEMRAELNDALGLALTWFRDAVLVAEHAPDHLLIHLDRKSQLLSEVAREEPAGLQEKCQAVLHALDQMQRNVNMQLLLDGLCMQLVKGLRTV